MNWDEVGPYLLTRAERECGDGAADPAGVQLLDELRAHAEGRNTSRPAARLRGSDVLLPVHIRRGDLELRSFTTIMTFGTPQDVTLQELRLETFFPADQESAQRWTAFALGE